MVRMMSIAVAVVLASAAAAMTDEPTGFSSAKFGMALDEVKQQYPKMEELAPTQNLGAGPIGGPYISRYVLRQQQIKGLDKPVDVELRFWKGRFWLYAAYFGENEDAKVKEFLRTRHGAPTLDDPRFPQWVGEKSSISVVMTRRWFGANDNKISEEARAWFKEMLTGGMQGGVGAANAGGEVTPAATSAPSPAATTAATPPAGEQQ